MPPRTRKAAEPAVATPKLATAEFNLQGLLLDMAAVLVKHAKTLPGNPHPALLKMAGGDSAATDEVPWDEGEPAMNKGAADRSQAQATLATQADLGSSDDLDEAPPAPAAKVPVKKAPAKKTLAKTPPAPEPDEMVEIEELDRSGYEAQLREMGDKELRALAISMDWEPADVRAASFDEIVGAILDEKYPEEDAGEEPAAPDDLDEEVESIPSNGVAREELMEMNLPALRQVAGGLGISEESYIGLDIDAMADLIMSYQEGNGGDEEGEFWVPTREELEAMSRKDLWDLCTNSEPEGYGYNLPKNITQAQMVTLILNGPTAEVPGF